MAVRQIEHHSDGIRRYWWGRREDERRFLTDQHLEPDNEPLLPLTVDEFEHAWNSR